MQIAFRRLCACLLAALLLSLPGNVCRAQGDSAPRLIGMAAAQQQDDDPVGPVVALTSLELASFAQATAALERQVNGDYLEAPLIEVVRYLSRTSGCTMLIDEKALADAAISNDTLITLHLGRHSLRTVLDEALRPHALAWLPKHPGILITTQEQVDTNPDFRFVYLYPVADLISVPGSDQDDYDSLIDTITSVIHPESWREGGTGEGVIVPMPSAEALIVTQPLEIQGRIAAFLDALRHVQRKQGLSPAAIASRNMEDRYLVKPVSTGRRRTYLSRRPGGF